MNVGGCFSFIPSELHVTGKSVAMQRYSDHVKSDNKTTFHVMQSFSLSYF